MCRRGDQIPTTIAVREATVGPLFGTCVVSGCAMVNVFVGQAEGFGGNLAENGIGALAEFGAGNQDAHAPSAQPSTPTTEFR